MADAPQREFKPQSVEMDSRDAVAGGGEMPQALRDIIQAVAASGSHVSRWSDLRTSCFPGATGWSSLKAWCAENGIDCEMCFSQSSKAAEVQFRRHPRNPKRLPA